VDIILFQLEEKRLIYPRFFDTSLSSLIMWKWPNYPG